MARSFASRSRSRNASRCLRISRSLRPLAFTGGIRCSRSSGRKWTRSARAVHCDRPSTFCAVHSARTSCKREAARTSGSRAMRSGAMCAHSTTRWCAARSPRRSSCIEAICWMASSFPTHRPNSKSGSRRSACDCGNAPSARLGRYVTNTRPRGMARSPLSGRVGPPRALPTTSARSGGS